jgi:hypothetical protein
MLSRDHGIIKRARRVQGGLAETPAVPCSGQAYVGAFLRRSAVAPPGADALPQQSEGMEGGASTSASDVHAPTRDSDIHSIGTFCQVHHISEMESGTAQMLLLGHRRLRRLHTVRDRMAIVLQSAST